MTLLRHLAALALLLSALAACDGASKAAPVSRGLVVVNPFGDRPTFYDFRTVPFGEIVTHTFVLENTDPVAVNVLDLTPSCGCTMPRMNVVHADGTRVEGKLAPGDDPVLTIPPGAQAELVVRVDTTHVERMNIDKLTQIRLRCDSLETPYLTFELHLVVERAFRAVPASVDLGFVPRSTGKIGRSDLSYERRGFTAKILGVGAVEGPIDAVIDETQVGDETLWILSVTTRPGLALGPVQGKVTVKTSGADGTGVGPSFQVPVIGQVVEDVRLDPPVVFVAAGDARVEATLSALVPGERVRITASRVQGDGERALTVECTPISAGDDGRAARWTVALVRGAAELPSVPGELVLELDHPRVKELRVPVRVR